MMGYSLLQNIVQIYVYLVFLELSVIAIVCSVLSMIQCLTKLYGRSLFFQFLVILSRNEMNYIFCVCVCVVWQCGSDYKFGKYSL